LPYLDVAVDNDANHEIIEWLNICLFVIPFFINYRRN